VVTALATSYAVALIGGPLRWTETGRIVLIAVTVLVGQVSIGWSNDWIDAARDAHAHRRDKPVANGLIDPLSLRNAAFTALGVAVVLSFANGWRAGPVHLLVIGGGWLYNVGLKATVWSWVPYAVAFGALPVFVWASVLGAEGPLLPPWWTWTGTALLGVGAHVANVVPDIDDDLAEGIKGFPQRIGARWCAVLAPMLLLTGAAVALVGPATAWTRLDTVAAVAVVLLAIVAGVVSRNPARARWAFAATLLIAVIVVVALVTGTADLRA
jgi:4-hydroxybenzoate polyprenyltransferase